MEEFFESYPGLKEKALHAEELAPPDLDPPVQQ